MLNRLRNKPLLVCAPTVGRLLIVGCLLVATPAGAADEDDPRLHGWARLFAVHYCPQDCSELLREANEALAESNTLPLKPRPTERNLAIRARAEIAPRDYEACARKASTERDALRHEAAQLDCKHILALASLPVRCAADLQGRIEVCQAEEAKARDRAEAIALAQKARNAAALTALRKEPRLMLITYSAALCVYDQMHARLSRTRVGSSVAPLLSGVIAEKEKPDVRLHKLQDLTRRTRTKLKSDWHVPPLPCTDHTVAHVADCLWLEDFTELRRDHPGTLVPERCTDAIAVRANRVGHLLPLRTPVEDSDL